MNREGPFSLPAIFALVALLLAGAAHFAPRFYEPDPARGLEVVQADLERLVQAQQDLQGSGQPLATSILDDHLGFTPSPRISVTIEYVLPDGSWLATAELLTLPQVNCAVAVGEYVPPSYSSGRVVCAEVPHT